mgnify:CR=1 FL=1
MARLCAAHAATAVRSPRAAASATAAEHAEELVAHRCHQGTEHAVAAAAAAARPGEVQVGRIGPLRVCARVPAAPTAVRRVLVLAAARAERAAPLRSFREPRSVARADGDAAAEQDRAQPRRAAHEREHGWVVRANDAAAVATAALATAASAERAARTQAAASADTSAAAPASASASASALAPSAASAGRGVVRAAVGSAVEVGQLHGAARAVRAQPVLRGPRGCAQPVALRLGRVGHAPTARQIGRAPLAGSVLGCAIAHGFGALVQAAQARCAHRHGASARVSARRGGGPWGTAWRGVAGRGLSLIHI